MNIPTKQCIAPVLLCTLYSAAATHAQVTPAVTSSPTPYPAISTNCASYEAVPALYDTCTHFFHDEQGILVANSETETNFSTAGENWIILIDGRNGNPVTVNSGNPLSLKDKQTVAGVYSEGNQSVLTYSQPAPMHLMDADSISFSIHGLKFEGKEFETPAALLSITSSKIFSLIGINTFITTKTKNIGIEIKEKPNAHCGTSYMLGNTYELNNNEQGVRIRCLQEQKEGVSSTLSRVNRFNLAGQSTGILVESGILLSARDQFIQSGPQDSQDPNNPQPPVAISFSQTAQAEAMEDQTLPFHEANIHCDTFDGGTYGSLIPVKLSDSATNPLSHHQITIAHNTFKNVKQVIQLSESDSHQSISAQSVCNIWENDDNSINRCPMSMNPDEFIHFTDGVFCGTQPESFTVDCAQERAYTCKDSQPESSRAASREILSTTPTPEATSSSNNHSGDNNEASLIGVSVGVIATTILTAVAVVIVIAVKRSLSRTGVTTLITNPSADIGTF